MLVLTNASADNMPALSFTSLDRLIESSGSPSKDTVSSSDCTTPFSFYPPLYTTPSQQRPPSPSSFSPSPYVLNFKRRGPVQQQVNAGKSGAVDASTDSSSLQQPFRMDADHGEDVKTVSTQHHKLLKNADSSPNVNGLPVKSHEVLAENDVFEIELDRRDGSKIVPAFENHGMVDRDQQFTSDSSAKKVHGTGCELQAGPSSVSSPAINEDLEFFDAPDAVLSDSASEDDSLAGKAERCVGGCSTQTPSRLEDEISRRMKAEEAVILWQRRWNEMAKRCSSIGLSISVQTGEFLGKGVNSLEVLNQELIVARLVGGAIARAVARAEKDEEFESVLATKNREISRLWDKLQYLELVNREMSQRNLEVKESTQRRRKRRHRRRKLALGGFCAAFCIGTAGFLCCKYIPWDHTKGVANLFEKYSVGDSSFSEAASQ